MKRVGIAASKMAQGNWTLYNLYVVLLAFLFSLLIFFVAGAAVMVALVILLGLYKFVIPGDTQQVWDNIFPICMISLSCMIGIFNLLVLLKNLKWPKK